MHAVTPANQSRWPLVGGVAGRVGPEGWSTLARSIPDATSLLGAQLLEEVRDDAVRTD